MLCRSDIAEHPPAHFDTAIPPVRPVSVVPHMPTHGNSSGNSKALLSGDRRRLVNALSVVGWPAVHLDPPRRTTTARRRSTRHRGSSCLLPTYVNVTKSHRGRLR